ncbi:hypothetical protein [Mesobacterium pallidum]|uniref:hypothetical protein n=1 Tax=Mesobacterium pallidum TaxID=2872037 RepID=UPI001EE39701|nr:hypothetical protein [Mesobacterium pallidum]
MQENAKPGLSGLSLCWGRYEAAAARGDAAWAEAAAMLATEIDRRLDATPEAMRLVEVNRAAGRARIDTLTYRALAEAGTMSGLRALTSFTDAMDDCARLLAAEGLAPPR